MRPRDMLRFGELYLRGGVLDDTVIVPPEWVALSTTATAPSPPWSEDFGYWWWIRPFAGVPSYHARGFGGQVIIIVPTLDMVVVTTSTFGGSATRQAIFDEVIEPHVIPAAIGD